MFTLIANLIVIAIAILLVLCPFSKDARIITASIFGFLWAIVSLGFGAVKLANKESLLINAAKSKVAKEVAKQAKEKSGIAKDIIVAQAKSTWKDVKVEAGHFTNAYKSSKENSVN